MLTEIINIERFERIVLSRTLSILGCQGGSISPFMEHLGLKQSP